MGQVKDAPRYEITTLNDFLRVPEGRLLACLTEFADWIEVNRRVRDLVATLAPDTPIEQVVTAERFVWIDDGERNVGISLRDPDGEVLRVDFPEHGEPEMQVRPKEAQ